ncbi:alpha/beta hydrolase [Candidatus Pacearchaeota archaeon]|nr:alpha/beta hydrolase [Candidatus Pacearchaeota archaeon]
MIKKVFIIHRWDGNPEADWYPWLKKELEKRKFIVKTPDMPNPQEPQINKWTSFINEKVHNPDKNTYFIGHSIGCQTILRYLETLHGNIKIGGVILVAPWINLKNLETEDEKRVAKSWLISPISWDKIKKHCSNFIAVFSDNDPFVPLSDKEIFKKKLNAEVITEHNKGHFTSEDNIKELRVVLNELIKISKQI